MSATLRLSADNWDQALAETNGRQVVVAGPGTGKTEFLIRRVGHLIKEGLARPDEVVLVSFSRRATARLRSRIESAMETSTVPVDVTTFHSLALRLIEATTSGDRPIPLTTPEQVAVVRELLTAEDTKTWPLIYRGILDTQPFATEVADFLLRCSERLLTVADLENLASERADWRGLPGLYHRYLNHLNELGRTDYGVLLTEAVDILGTDAGHQLASEFKYVLVDEYQDTSPAQAALAERLAVNNHITVAGDPYQSIYSFRGAEVRNIAEFASKPGTRRWILSESFRVPAEIMEPALRIVSGGDLPGAAGAVTPAPHVGVTETYIFDQETGEAEWIAREIEHMANVEALPLDRIAVVVRSKRHLVAELSRALTRKGIAHDHPDSRLVDHPAVRTIQDVVTIATADDNTVIGATSADGAMRRLLLGPLYGLSVGKERSLLRRRRATTTDWKTLLESELPGASGLIGLLDETKWATQSGAADGFWKLWTDLDGIEELVNQPDRAEWRRAWTAFGQMLARQGERDPNISLVRFFEMIDEDDFEATPLISHRSGDKRVTLTTLHQVKGLEFDTVFIANAVEGVFPDLRRSRRMLRPELLSPERTVDPAAQHLFQIQEEMRLAYTAMTRATRRVVWTATEAGVDQGEMRPSRFLLAAAGSNQPKAPQLVERQPTTVSETEVHLRRLLSDPSQVPARRLAAASVLGRPPRKWWDPMSFAGAPLPGPDSPVLGDKIVLSPSQAQAYEACPRRYVLERKLRLGDPTSVWSHFGELCHDVLERAEAEIIGTGNRHADLGRVLEIVEEVWEESAEFGTDDLTRAWQRKAIEMLTRLYQLWPGRGEPLTVEMDVDSYVDGVRWVGRVDRVEQGDEGVRVVDYKTGTSVPTGAEAAESIQLGFYAKAIQERLGSVVASEMWFPRTRAQKITTRSFSMHVLDQIEQKMIEITHAISEENWEPKVSEMCTRCSFRRSCPAWPEGRGAFLS